MSIPEGSNITAAVLLASCFRAIILVADLAAIPLVLDFFIAAA